MSRFVCIVGPTASGKSSLAMQIAQKYDGEIICADSQTVRIGLDIGTAKPTAKDRVSVPHHLVDIIMPYEKYSAAKFKRAAEQIISDIHARGKLPVIVGGTGLYIDALLFDFSFNKKTDSEARDRLNAIPVAELQKIIIQKNLKMPTNKNNPRHLIRTIESAGRISTKKEQRKDVIVIGLDPGKDVLNERITDRIKQMMNEGFIDEVKRVVASYGTPPEQWDAIGYKIILKNLDKNGNIAAENVQSALITAHRQYAKRQRSWFKRNKNIMWFEQSGSALEYVKKQLSEY